MKKTLLCFLFLFTTVFYAQVTNITICETEPFNLTSLKADFIGNLNPDETTVSYYLSLEDATNNTNVIANATNYIGTPGITKIYGRIDNNGTITTNYFNLTVFPSLNVSASNTPVLCQGSNTASLTINVSPSGSYQYSINGGLFTSNDHYNNLVAGVYTIKVKSTNPICPDVTINHVITEPATLNTTAMISGQMATITAVGGTPPYQYSLEGISYQPSSVFQNLTPGNHIFMVRDFNGCIATVQATVLPALTTTAVITKEMDCSPNSNASIAVFAAGGQSPYTYSLNGSPFQVNNNFSNLIPGTYSITARDAVNTISNPTSIVISPLVVLRATAVVTNPTSCSTGTITAMATGGKAPYIYSFDGGITFISSNVFSTPNPGTYVIIVKDSKGCLSSSLTKIIQPATPLFITASNTLVSCNGGSDASLTINANGGKAPYQYAINNGVYTSSNIFTSLNAGTYTLKVRDAAGCVSTIDQVINQPPALIVLLSTSGNKITLTSSGGTPPYQYSLDGGSFQTSNVFTVLTSGNYLTEARDSNGCTRTFATAIVVPDPLISSAILVKESDCISGASIDANAIGGQPPYAYSINGGVSYQLTNTFTNIPAGTYTVKVKDFANTFSNSNTIVVNSPRPITATAVVTPSDCTNNSITVQATGGQVPYIYSIDGGVTYGPANVFTNVLTGTYNIVVKDSNSCVSPILSTIVQSPSPLVITASNTLISCYGGTASIIINPVGGQAPYEYSINNSPYTISNIYSGLTSGTYTIRVRDAIDCLSELNYLMTEPTALTATASTFGQNIVITTVGGKAPYQYSLDGVNYQSSPDFQYVTPGNHIFMVTDFNGCIATVPATVLPALTATAVITKEMDCSVNSNASITVTAAAGQSPYTYSLNGGPFQSSNNFSNLIPGTYSIVVKDANNTLATTNNITVSPLSFPIISVTKINPSCYQASNGIINVQAQGGKIPYMYSIGGGYTSSNVFTNLVAGIYNVTVKDVNGCLSSSSIMIDEPSPIAITTNKANSTTINDNNGKITVTATGGVSSYTYALTNFNGIIIRAFQSSNIFDGLQAGLYGVQVQDANGCIASKTDISIINKINNLSATFTITQITCNDLFGTLTVIAVGGTVPYQYSADNGITYSTSNVFNLTAGSYTLKVRDADNNTTVLATTIADHIAPSFYYNTYKGICSTSDVDRGGITIAASGGQPPYTYSFNGGPFVVHDDLYEGLEPGIYTFSIKDANGCTSATQNFTIEEPDPIISKVIVDNQTITVKALGQGRSYEYSLDGINFQSNNVFANLKKGTYTVFIRDFRGCRATHSDIIIYEPTSLTANFEITPLTCDSTTGKLNIIALGGIAPYQYSIDNGNTYTSSNLFTGLFPGSYAIIVKDAQNSTASSTAVIKPIELLAVTAVVTKGIDCLSNASITVNAIGGNGPYTYSIGNGYTKSNIFTNLTSQTYTVSTKDAFGCIATTSATILQPTILSLSNIGTNSKTLGSSDGTITITASGGTAPYQYLLKYENGSQITVPQNSSVFTGLSVGKYTIEVTDTAGCKVNKSGILITSDTIFGTLMTTPVTCTTLGSITINAAGGKYPHQYSFNNGITYGSSNIASNLQSGTYNIKVKDAGGDILTLSTSLSAVNPVVATTAITSPIHCNGSNDAVIQITATGGKTPYFYSINGSAYQSSNTFSNLYAGNHIITVKDSNGCTAISAVELTAPLPITASLTVVDQTVTITAVGGSGKYLYAISPNTSLFSANNTFTNLEAGNYTVIVQDESGCYVMLNFVINPPAPLIESKDAITVDFKPGQTLADLIVEGQNIKWYNTPNALEGKTSKTNETPLPLTTILVNGTTYYASQTINGIESKNRLAVTVKLNGSLSTPDFVLTNFKYYPNPVLHNLTISNSSIIDEVEVVSVTGQSILSKTINSDHSEIDLSNVSSGVYLLKVKSEGKTKTVKIVKK